MSETPVKPETEEIDLLELAKKNLGETPFYNQICVDRRRCRPGDRLQPPKRIHFIGENGTRRGKIQ